MSSIPVVHCFPAATAGLLTHHQDLLGGREVVGLDAESFATELPSVQALVAHEPPRGVWHRAERLQLIQTLSVGLDALLPAPDLPVGVKICNTSGLSAPAMGEFAVTQLLSMVKKLPLSWTHQQAKAWVPTQPGSLRGRRVAVLGTGAVGREVARLLSALGAVPVGFTRRARPITGFDQVWGLDELATGLASCDDVVVALPSVAATQRLLDAVTLQALRPGAHVVNVARGDLVDEAALLDALASGQVAGAALDTTVTEPLPADSPLWQAPGVLLTPHVSWYSPDYTRDVVALFAANLDALEQGGPVRNLVDRDLGFHPLPD